jgi:hypothetical protein
MSHDATNWAIKQRGLKPATKIVLWHLCDRYHPDHGCFPSLDTLADDCEMSRRSVQDHLAELERVGLIKIEKMERSRGQLPRNLYVLAFEKHLGQNLPQAKSALGKIEPPPLANPRNHLGQNLPTNSVKGTSKGTSNEDARAVSELLEIYATPQAVTSFMAYRRKSKGKALTLTAAKRLANNLRAIAERGGDPDDALGMAEERVWLTVEPDWYFNARGKSNGTHKAIPADNSSAFLRSVARAAGSF